MPFLEGFWIKNFRALKQFAIGSCYLQFVYVDEDITQTQYELSPTTILIGRNGAGKSTVLDAFAFVCDCIKLGVEDACQKRGGYDSLYSQGSTGPLSFGFNFRASPSKILTYVLNIDFGVSNRPYVETELLAYRAESIESFQVPILFFQNGQKIVRHFLVSGKGNNDLSQVELTDMRHLGLASLGDLQEYPVVGKIKDFFAKCSLSSYSENLRAFSPPSMVFQGVSNFYNEELVALLRYFRKEYPDRTPEILNRIAAKLPDVEMIDVGKGTQNRLSLVLKKKNFPNPFYGNQLPEGLLKLLTYYCLLEEPKPVPFVGIDEPENGLDAWFLKSFLDDVQAAVQTKNSSQFLFATHFHGLANWMAPTNVWILETASDGFTQVQRGSDYPIVNDMVRNDQPVGDSWYSDFCV
ncbi:MAG: AAA family ATPase [Planctomycetaceae bacterium]|nr:AAA family ATPase [Planctomycetaceae bacterium]